MWYKTSSKIDFYCVQFTDPSGELSIRFEPITKNGENFLKEECACYKQLGWKYGEEFWKTIESLAHKKKISCELKNVEL